MLAIAETFFRPFETPTVVLQKVFAFTLWDRALGNFPILAILVHVFISRPVLLCVFPGRGTSN